MKRINKFKLSVALLLGMLVAGCQPNNSNESDNLDQIKSAQRAESVDKGVFGYKGAYVGDNSAVGNILTRLPVSSYSKDFELATVAEPYGIIINYDGSEPPQQRSEIMVYTATYLFTLLRNADWVTFNFTDQSVKLTKSQLYQWYGEDLSRIDNEEALKRLIEKNMNNEQQVAKLFQ